MTAPQLILGGIIPAVVVGCLLSLAASARCSLALDAFEKAWPLAKDSADLKGNAIGAPLPTIAPPDDENPIFPMPAIERFAAAATDLDDADEWSASDDADCREALPAFSERGDHGGKRGQPQTHFSPADSVSPFKARPPPKTKSQTTPSLLRLSDNLPSTRLASFTFPSVSRFQSCICCSKASLGLSRKPERTLRNPLGSFVYDYEECSKVSL